MIETAERDRLPAERERDGAPTMGYWELVLRDFRRNRGAVFGAFVVLAVVTVAVFCPLLANQRPLYWHAPLAADFDNAVALTMERTRSLAGADGDAARVLHGQILGGFERMEEHLSEDGRTLLEELRAQFRAASPVPAERDSGALERVAQDMEALFDAELRPVTRYPAFRSLTSGEIYVLAAYFLAIGVILARRRIPYTLLRLVIILGGAGLVTAGIKHVYPGAFDTRPYRQMISAPGFEQAGGRVVRPPVPYGENENIIRDARQRPSWLLAVEDRRPVRDWHWLGTDTNGRDVLSRMIYGARVSMLVGVFAVGIYTIVGIFLGALAGYFGRWVDIGLSRIIEIVICFPPLMVILAVQAFLQPALTNLILALAALWWTGVARLQRAEFLRLVNQDFVQSVRALGGSNLRIIFLHILPNGLGPILVIVSFGIAGSIVIESALSFLGFGVPQPMASWGDLLNNGRNDIQGTWWLTVFPGIAIFLTVTCFNLMGEGVRDALDPRKER